MFVNRGNGSCKDLDGGRTVDSLKTADTVYLLFNPRTPLFKVGTFALGRRG